MKYIIFKDFDGYKMTDIDNYNARIRNERKVSNWSEFDNPTDIINYCYKYFDKEHKDTYIVA